MTVAITVVVDPAKVASEPVVIVAIPGGTYHRRYWDLQPPGGALVTARPSGWPIVG